MNEITLQRAQAEGYKIRSFSTGTLSFLEFNFRKGRPTANKNLRKAIAAVVDPAEYIEKVIGIPGTKPGVGLIPGGLRGKKELFRKEYPIEMRRRDFAAAKQYVEAAKRELGGTIPPLVWLTGDTPGSAKAAEYFQSLFKRTLAIELRIDQQIFKQRLAKMRAGDFDIVPAGWAPDYFDPMTFADLWASWNENNHGKYVNAEVDRLIREAQATSDPKKRMDAMAQAEKIALDDLAALPITESTVMFVTRLEGAVARQVGPNPDFTFANVKE